MKHLFPHWRKNVKSKCQLTLVAAAGLLISIASVEAQEHSTPITSTDGTPTTLTSGQPAPNHYGPAPTFDQLDANPDGYVNRNEAEAYIPLFNDFDFLAHHAERISKRQFENWARTQIR